MRESRAEFALLNLPSQSAPTHLLAIGGINEAGILRNAEKYSIQDNRWESSAPLPLALHGLAGELVCLSVCLSICLSVCLSVCLSICLSV